MPRPQQRRPRDPLADPGKPKTHHYHYYYYQFIHITYIYIYIYLFILLLVFSSLLYVSLIGYYYWKVETNYPRPRLRDFPRWKKTQEHVIIGKLRVAGKKHFREERFLGIQAFKHQISGWRADSAEGPQGKGSRKGNIIFTDTGRSNLTAEIRGWGYVFGRFDPVAEVYLFVYLSIYLSISPVYLSIFLSMIIYIYIIHM